MYFQSPSTINGCNIWKPGAYTNISYRNVHFLYCLLHRVPVLLRKYFRGLDHHHISRAGWGRASGGGNWQKSGYTRFPFVHVLYCVIMWNIFMLPEIMYRFCHKRSPPRALHAGGELICAIQHCHCLDKEHRYKNTFILLRTNPFILAKSILGFFC